MAISEAFNGILQYRIYPSGGPVSRIVCIVGMHRSGTSCLAGSLEEAGLHLGDVSKTGRHNAKGNRESSRIMALQEAVLDYSGGGWNRPPERVIWSDSHRAERDAIIRSHGDRPAWGFKDPRSVLLTEFWLEALPNLTFVGTLRHPRLVAESLCRRSNGSMAAWLDLWTIYNERMLALHEADPFPIVCFDVGEESYRRALAAVLDRLRLPAPTRMEFFDPALRHHVTASVDGLPERVVRVYNSLSRIALAL